MLIIRPGSVDDARAMLQAHREAVFAKAGRHYSQARMEEWSPGASSERMARLEKEIADPNLIVLVAVAGTEVIGFSMVNIGKSELGAIYVKPNDIGNIGRDLLIEIEKRATDAGLTQLVCDASLNAEAFYTRNGYFNEGPIEHRLATGGTVPCVRMRKVFGVSQGGSVLST